MQIVTIKTRLVFQSEEDKISIISMLERARDCWNFISEQHFSTNEYGFLDCKNSITELHKKVYFQSIHKFSIKSSIVVQLENSVLSVYRSIKSNKHKINRPAKKRKMSLSTNENCINFTKGKISIISLDKRIKCQFQLFSRLENFLSKHKHGDPTIFVKNNEVWISLPFKIAEPEIKSTLALGIDLGLCRFAATSEGKLFKSRKFLAEKRKLRHLKSKLQSKKTKSARRHLKKLRHKEKFKNLNFSHSLANAIISSTKANVLVLEDLNVKKMKEKKKFNKTTNQWVKSYGSKNRISQFGLGQLLFFITYKAKLAGKSVILVNPAYTSQTDHITGKVEGERIGRRFYAKSGHVYDSDINAAVNIAKRSEHPISCSNVLDGQGLVIDPIVC